jgi:hypothetical protein
VGSGDGSVLQKPEEEQATADQILLGDDRLHFILAEGAEEASAEMQRRYDVGLKRVFCILIQAICATTRSLSL